MSKRLSAFSLLPLAAALAATGAMAAVTGAQVASRTMFASTTTSSTRSSPFVTSAAPTSSAPATSSGTTTGTTTTMTTSTGSTSGATNTPSTTTNTNPANATAVIPTQITPSSATAAGIPTPGQTSGVSIAGTSTGDAFSGTSRGEAPAVGALAASGVTTNTNETGINTALASNGPLGFPVVLDNGLVAPGAVSINGELSGNPAANTGGNAVIASNGAILSGAAIAPQVGVATSNNDPLVRRELNKRRNLRRNGQLLYSIAPRTNVDRSWQMPDDPISPALRPPA